MYEYSVGVYNAYKQWTVTFNTYDESISCSCKMFESCGILCRHCIKVFDTLDIKTIPYNYIIKRWTRNARDNELSDFHENSKLGYSERYMILSSAVHDLRRKIREAREPDNFVEETTLNPTRNLTPENSPSLIYTARGIKKKQNTRCKKRRPKTWIERMKKTKGGAKANNFNSEYQENIEVGSNSHLNFTNLLMKEMRRHE